MLNSFYFSQLLLVVVSELRNRIYEFYAIYVSLHYFGRSNYIISVLFFKTFVSLSFDQWKQCIANCEEDLTHLGDTLGDTSRITDGEKTIPGTEVKRWTVTNAKVPVMAAIEKDVADGTLFSIVPSEGKTGSPAGEMALKIMEGTDVARVKMQPITKGRLVINAKTALTFLVRGLELKFHMRYCPLQKKYMNNFYMRLLMFF